MKVYLSIYLFIYLFNCGSDKAIEWRRQFRYIGRFPRLSEQRTLGRILHWVSKRGSVCRGVQWCLCIQWCRTYSKHTYARSCSSAVSFKNDLMCSPLSVVPSTLCHQSHTNTQRKAPTIAPKQTTTECTCEGKARCFWKKKGQPAQVHAAHNHTRTCNLAICSTDVTLSYVMMSIRSTWPTVGVCRHTVTHMITHTYTHTLA